MTDAERDLEMVKELAAKLSEHFDCVQIFASRHEPATDNGTVNLCFGVGNWFARYGQTRDWVVKSDERTRCAVQKEEAEEKAE